MKNVTKVYLISGRTGAGKTAVSKRMASEKKAFRISHDEWLRITYGAEIEKECFQVKCEKINQLIWNQIESLNSLGVSVILEGWGSRKLRDDARKKLEELKIEYEFIFVDCPVEERWTRVQNRNKALGKEGVYISKEDFERMEIIKEEFDEDERVTNFDNSKHNKSLEPAALAEARALDQL